VACLGSLVSACLGSLAVACLGSLAAACLGSLVAACLDSLAAPWEEAAEQYLVRNLGSLEPLEAEEQRLMHPEAMQEQSLEGLAATLVLQERCPCNLAAQFASPAAMLGPGEAEEHRLDTSSLR